MYGEPKVAERLPPESEMDRQDALRAFIAVINTAKPDHAYLRDPWPIGPDDVDYGVTRRCYARCGPRNNPSSAVAYSTRMTYINGIGRERHLALLTHEITHVTQNCSRGDTWHPTQFWREMAFHALEIRDALEDGVLEPIFGPVDTDGYLRQCATDPNSSTVDRRSMSVEECRDLMRDLLGL